MRRRKNRSTWFPVLPTEQSTGDATWGWTFLEYQNTIDTGDAGSTAVAWPLVNDVSADANTQAGVSLRDEVEGQTWICERVVGNIWASCNEVSGSSESPIICCAALAVFPVDSDSTDEDAPELTNEEYNPLNANNSAKPWLWRRTWLLGNPVSQDVGNNFGFPYNNAITSGRDTGPFLDTKGVKRVIQRDQRLFLVSAIASASGDAIAGGALGVSWVYDLRVLGRLIKAKNRSSFK